MKKFYLQIPEPCHEDWNNMTSAEKGRYCNSCCKTVVDFTMMTDQEIISYFSKAEGRTCGHFANDQLNRVLKEPATPAKKNIWAVMLSFMLPIFAWNKATAQGKVKVDTTKEQVNTWRGDTIIFEKPKERTITGKVFDAEGNALESVSVMIKGKRLGTTTDSTGCFELKVDSNKNITLIFSYVGYLQQEVFYPVNRSHTLIQLIRNDEDLDVIIMGVVIKKTFTRPVPKKIIDTIVQAIEPSRITVFPNPVTKGSTVTIKLKGISSYECYLIDNQGNLIDIPSYEQISKHEAQLQLPSAIAPGFYYITVFDKRSKKKHTEKIVVQ